MTNKIGVIMDALSTINVKKDSTIALLEAALGRGWEVFYFEPQDLCIKNGVAFGRARQLSLQCQEKNWYQLSAPDNIELASLDYLLMRSNPPVDENYLYSTYILDIAFSQGVHVINQPQGLRAANEKIFATRFANCMIDTIVTQSISDAQDFWQTHQDIICKPLNGMGGKSIFRLQKNDVNANVIFETLLANNTFIMVQKFIPEITQGDKRILILNGEAYPYALARVPQVGDWRGNLAAGAQGEARQLTARDRFICSKIIPSLIELGLNLVGIDVIGDYLTEINVTSPTGIRELDQLGNVDIANIFWDGVIV